MFGEAKNSTEADDRLKDLVDNNSCKDYEPYGHLLEFQKPSISMSVYSDLMPWTKVFLQEFRLLKEHR
jgi:hypothetical protein